MTTRELIETIAKKLVDFPDDVTVTEVKGQTLTVFEVKTRKDDTGKIIGKQGRTAAALRTIMIGIAGKEKQRAVLEILE